MHLYIYLQICTSISNVYAFLFLHVCRDEWVEEFYKYNSATRMFQSVPSRSFTVMTDGVSIDLSKVKRSKA